MAGESAQPTVPTAYDRGRLTPRIAAVLFAGIVLVQLAWAPLDPMGMGYTEDEVASSFLMLAWLSGDLAGRPASELLGRHGLATAHGVVEPLVKLPFALAGKGLAPLFPASPRFAERFLMLVPLLETAGLATLLFLWAARLAGDLRWGVTVALGAAFCTLLWPYAYTGLEPTQSLLLLTIGYLALSAETAGATNGRGVGRMLGFLVLAALTVTTKRTGLLLLPAVGFLIDKYIRQRFPFAARWKAVLALLASVLFILAVNYGNGLLRAGYYPPWSNAALLHRFVETNPVRIASSVLMLLFSGNKGLILFAPVAALALWTLPALWRSHRDLATFTLLVLAAILGGFAVVGIPADETWGPRYLHGAIPLLLLSLAAVWGKERIATFQRLLLVLALLVGFAVSGLGTMFYYGRLSQAAEATRQSTLEAFWADPVWNAITMQLRLTRLWLAPEGTSTVWTPQHKWWFTPPADLPPEPSVDLAFALEPQPLLLRQATHARPRLLAVLVGSLLCGLAALGAAVSWAWRAARIP